MNITPCWCRPEQRRRITLLDLGSQSARWIWGGDVHPFSCPLPQIWVRSGIASWKTLNVFQRTQAPGGGKHGEENTKHGKGQMQEERAGCIMYCCCLLRCTWWMWTVNLSWRCPKVVKFFGFREPLWSNRSGSILSTSTFSPFLVPLCPLYLLVIKQDSNKPPKKA